MPDQPKSIVYIRPDTIGDLVIFTSALAQLQAAWPDARHTLVVRPGYEALAPLFPAGLHWHVVPINPFTQQPGASREALAVLYASLDGLAPDTIVAPTLNRTWLEVAIAVRYPNARRVVLGRGAVDPLFANRLKLELGIEATSAFGEIVPADERRLDWENNHRLVDHLLGRSAPREFPRLQVPPEAAADAGGFLRAAGLVPGEFVAVFPGGLANVPIKAWPYPNFGELIRWLQREKGARVLLLGHISEQDILSSVAAEAVKAGGETPAAWLGRDGDLPWLAGLLSLCRLYVGHDTGAMHIAAAVGRPVVGLFGGGHWPRFRPVGPQAVSIVQPMPCFGCNWDCRFGDAPCVKLLATDDVIQGVELLWDRKQPLDHVVEVKHLSEETERFIAAVTPRYAGLQADRVERQHRIEELKREADIKDTEINALKCETDVKDSEIDALKDAANEKDREIGQLKATNDGRAREIESLKLAADDRKAEMEAIKAELEDECTQKDREIDALKGEATTKDAEIASLKDVCNERERLIIQQDAHIKNFQATVAQLRKDLEERQTASSAVEAELERLRTVFSRLPADAETWSLQFRDKDVHIQNLENMLADRERQITTLRDSVSNYAEGYGALEQVKHYGKLLAEKEAVIQTLHRACVEREVVIKQLALDAVGPLGWLNKLWYATRKHVDLKYRTPFKDWLFKKVVEEYWMQIGILQHYEPRPIAWDSFPKPRLPESRLPRIGIVTPSYAQATYVESTMLSVLNQKYSKLCYVVQDGGSKDASPQIIARYADRLHHWESVRDKGQADAIRKGFAHLNGHLGADDLMAWLNSDDFIAPRALRYVAEYFARHPEVDVVYGHRIIIDGEDREVGRWIMPRHDPQTLEWIDYVPQETLFWRRRIWDKVGGIDPTFQFALDWDLLARFQQANARVVRLPYFLGCFRVHKEQKTSQQIHTVGNEEMIKIRSRFHGDRHSDFETINRFARKARFTGALTARLASMGIRY